MRVNAFLSLSILSNLLRTVHVSAQDIDDVNIPSQCVTVCDSLVVASNTCEDLIGDNDVVNYYDCMCAGTNALEVITVCEACVYEARKAIDPDEDEAWERSSDVNELFRRCSFTVTTTYSLSGSVTPTLTPMTPNTAVRGLNGQTSTASGTASSSSTSTGTGRGVAATASVSGVTTVAASASAGTGGATASAGGAAATANAGISLSEMNAGDWAAAAGVVCLIGAAWF